MKRQKSTKKALFSSILSLIVCLSMLVGTTFAWFTDSVTSANNIIKSGNLDVELYYQNDTVTEWTKVTESTNIFKADTLWEPGHTEVVKLKVVNEGSLALKYRFGINVASETGSINKDGKEFKLSDYIYFGVADGVSEYTRESAVAAVKDSAVTVATGITKANSLEANKAADEMTLVVYMPETVGNEANYKKDAAVPTINLGLNLFATQYTSEADSFDNQYDANARFELEEDAEGNYLISSPEDLMAFNEELNQPGLNGEGNRMTFKLTTDLDMAGYEWLSVNEMFLTFDGQGHTISNLNCVENGNKSGFFAYLGGGTIKNLTLKNVVSVGSQAGIFVGQAEAGNVINCNIEGVNLVAWDDDSADAVTKNGVGAYVGVSVESNETSGTIANGTVIAMSTTGMNAAASGVWTTNNKYAGGLYTESQTVNVVDGATYVETLELYSEGLYKDAGVTKPTFYAVSAEGVAGFAAWRNATNVTEGSPINAICNLVCDVDMTDVEYTAFNGHFTQFNGNGHTISNITTKQGVSGKGGFVSYLGGGIIQDLTIENATVTGCQVGIFAGQSEGGKVLNCYVKGNNKVIWSQNTTSDYRETWNGIGAIVGYCSGGTFNVEIVEGAVVELNANGMETEGTKVDNLTGYGMKNSGEVVNNGTVIVK